MTAIRKSAKGETCSMILPDVCNFDRDTTVLAHAPHPDKGMSKKGPDSWSAYLCSGCHDEMDGRTHRLAMGADQWSLAWYFAIRETQRRLLKKGLLHEGKK